MAQQGGTTCIDGAVIAVSGALDVWVEDPAPECAGRDIGFKSSTDAYRANDIYFWTNSMTKLQELAVPGSSDRSQILIVGAVEGTPIAGETPYSCTRGTPNYNLAAQLRTNDRDVVATAKSAIPPFSGMGHLILSLSAKIPYRPETTSISIWVRSDIEPPVTTNGCGSTVPCGDGKLGFVKMGDDPESTGR